MRYQHEVSAIETHAADDAADSHREGRVLLWRLRDQIVQLRHITVDSVQRRQLVSSWCHIEYFTDNIDFHSNITISIYLQITLY